MTGWAWFWMICAWVVLAGWMATVWALRPRPVMCSCGSYRLNGWVRVDDESGVHEPERCQPPGESL